MNYRKEFRKATAVLAAIVLIGGFTACSSKSTESNRKTITVSIPPIKYLVDRISGNEFDVNVMVATGACQETYEPTPSQMKDVAKSKLYLGISELEFEQKWLNNIKANNPELKYANLSEGVKMVEGSCSHEECEEHEHHHGGMDPHIWLSPANYKVMATATLNELVTLNPKNKSSYEKNFKSLVASIDSIDAIAKSKLANLKIKKFIIYHPALSYFARDYGLEQISIEQDGKEPAADYMKRLVSQAKEVGIKTIFVQKEFDLSLIKSFAGEVGATIEPINTFAYDWLESTNHIINALYSANQ
ncbi:metal ABC transporter solute-binding protein, Zn/Mn family [uncultured Acetobacteroides sp.]|uniref:metal ABC transporter solute-binding protein, Zn/Mn family n=1 Tax=uncultured Acetobacteroides sp. TaxID=1760811 RepID=UPI0029F5931A|nr:zinc ABC transporter substrate-binding protein [uncultured Acetobacteroides sp.]